MKDFLGNEIKVGMRVVHVLAQAGSFRLGTVVGMRVHREYGEETDQLQVEPDGPTYGKPGWTYPYRVIVETAFQAGMLDENKEQDD